VRRKKEKGILLKSTAAYGRDGKGCGDLSLLALEGKNRSRQKSVRSLVGLFYSYLRRHLEAGIQGRGKKKKGGKTLLETLRLTDVVGIVKGGLVESREKERKKEGPTDLVICALGLSESQGRGEGGQKEGLAADLVGSSFFMSVMCWGEGPREPGSRKGGEKEGEKRGGEGNRVSLLSTGTHFCSKRRLKEKRWKEKRMSGFQSFSHNRLTYKEKEGGKGGRRETQKRREEKEEREKRES